jgi:hypothetical protein
MKLHSLLLIMVWTFVSISMTGQNIKPIADGKIKFLGNVYSRAQLPNWGINGYASVISTSLVIIIAVELGFMVVMLLAASAYTTVFLSNFLLVQKS